MGSTGGRLWRSFIEKPRHPLQNSDWLVLTVWSLLSISVHKCWLFFFVEYYQKAEENILEGGHLNKSKFPTFRQRPFSVLGLGGPSTICTFLTHLLDVDLSYSRSCVRPLESSSKHAVRSCVWLITSWGPVILTSVLPVGSFFILVSFMVSLMCRAASQHGARILTPINLNLWHSSFSSHDRQSGDCEVNCWLSGFSNSPKCLGLATALAALIGSLRRCEVTELWSLISSEQHGV